MVRELSLRGGSYKNPFGSWPFGSYRRQIKKNLVVWNFYTLCSNIAPTIYSIPRRNIFTGQIFHVAKFSRGRLILRINDTYNHWYQNFSKKKSFSAAALRNFEKFSIPHISVLICKGFIFNSFIVLLWKVIHRLYSMISQSH